MAPQPICAICGKSGVHKCSACENAYYCSRQHQKEDWKKHSKICKPFKLTENPTLGRYYVATRNIKQGEIVIKDNKPLVDGPMHNSVPVCLRCYTMLYKTTAVPCTKCGWPLCGDCKDHGLECDFTSSRRNDKVSITEFGYPHPSYQCINVIKVLSMKNNNPECYQKLLSLEGHSDRLKEERSFNFEKPTNTVNFIKRFFKTDDISEEEMIKIIGVLQVNGHEVPLTEPPYIAVYELASLLEHSCKANCSKSFTNEGGLIIHAATHITKGEHISICYTDPLWSTTNRRHHLFETKFFECICDRCKDPTEFGTMFNAIKCDKTNCHGYMLPKTFLDPEQMDYICSTCGSILLYKKVEEIQENIGIDLSRMKKNDIKACRTFLDRYKTVLHPNHFYNTDVTIALAQLIGQQDGGLQTVADDLLVKKLELCKKLDNLLKILAPAENRIRGLILFELHAAYADFSRRHVEEDTLLLLGESRKALVEAYRLLKLEPTALPEGKIAQQAQINLQKTTSILNHLNSASKS
ncbi:SET domain-containing protein SmydA-8-like isoform X1 [Hylaeus anthracinus]|uniref:SET domain-containing protein SmydA-8-like isoform X1 n=3 Tax=Hylaeus anthracinus TaxID=313031 RepID=UPI0023BA0ADA|nr:SET domain-containing protein SmydA-8-like isoform X1 [Hylaeus anthracinus]